MAEQKHKNESLNVEDTLTKSEEFIIKNKKSIIGSVVVIILVIVGILTYKNLYAEPREAKANAALFGSEELFTQNNFEQALNGDSLGSIGFINVIDQYSGTKAANLAKAYAGISYAQLGQFEKALPYLDDFKSNEKMVSSAVLAAAGNCYAQMGQLDKAAITLVNAANKSESNTLSPIFLQQAGEIYVKLGKYSDAIKTYNQIKDKYFQSYQAMGIDKYIEQATLLMK